MDTTQQQLRVFSVSDPDGATRELLNQIVALNPEFRGNKSLAVHRALLMYLIDLKQRANLQTPTE